MAVHLSKDTQDNIEQIAWFLFAEHPAGSAMLWHNELTPQQRYALRRHALDDYVAFLEMISRDYKSSKTKGRRERFRHGQEGTHAQEVSQDHVLNERRLDEDIYEITHCLGVRS